MKNRCYNGLAGVSGLVLSTPRAEDASHAYPGADAPPVGRGFLQGSRDRHPKGEGEMSATATGEQPYPTPKVGERVAYHSLQDGCFWFAKVMHVRADGVIDIDVDGQPPLRLAKVQWWAGNPADCPRRHCTNINMAERQR